MFATIVNKENRLKLLILRRPMILEKCTVKLKKILATRN